MKLSYYPGCSLQGTARDYDQSVRGVCGMLGIELVEIPDWNCCGASSAHMTSHEVGIRLPLRNLLIAADLGLDILVPCAACFQRLKAAEKALQADPEHWDIDGDRPSVRIIHISELLSSPGIDKTIRQQVQQGLGGLKIGCYYGCLSLRNPKITDVVNYEQPDKLERIVSAIGARPIRWSHRTECCSGSLTMARPDIARKLVADIVEAAVRGGADALVTDCPMCQANVEGRQLDLSGGPKVPVFFITELISAALTGDYPARQKKLHLVEAGVLSTAMLEQQRSREETV